MNITRSQSVSSPKDSQSKMFASLLRRLDEKRADKPPGSEINEDFKRLDMATRITNVKAFHKKIIKLEALEACYWLKATGFSSYVKMYEEKQFPIDISTGNLKEMLDDDSLQSLTKRLETLNKCAKLLMNQNVENTILNSNNNKNNKNLNQNTSCNRQQTTTTTTTTSSFETTSTLPTQIDSATTTTTTTTTAATIVPRNRHFPDSESQILLKQQHRHQSVNDVIPNLTAENDIASHRNQHNAFTRAFSHSGAFPVKTSEGNINNNNNNNNNNQELHDTFTPQILIEEEEEEDDDDDDESKFCEELEEKTANEILRNIRNSIYDNVPHDTMLNKALPSDVNIAFDESYFVTDLNIHVNQKIDGRRRASSEDDDDDESSLSQDEGEEIEDEVESIRSLDHLGIPGGMPEMKKPGMGSVDSGVPSSPVLRSPSVRKRRVRWHSFQKSCDRESMLVNNKIMSLSAGQLNVLKKLSLLRLTALLERYSCNNRTGWHWTMPKLLKKFKAPDYRDKNIFGVPLLVMAERTGNPLPHPILLALNYLSRTPIDSVGIFRKSGMKTRIDKLRTQIESNPDKVSFDDYSVYDVADTLKQYFRELPEPLLTTKLVDTFISIHKDIPKELRLQAMQLAIILMPDENRDLLQTVLIFLSDVASHSYVNQMTEKNLATCFVPAFFHLCGGSSVKNEKYTSSAPKKLKRSTSVQCRKELDDTMAAQECLSEMMKCVRFLFCVPDDVMMKSQFSYIQAGDPVSLEELGQNSIDPGVEDGYQHYLDNCFAGLLQETSVNSRTSKKWEVHSDTNGIVLSYRKVNDGYPLRLWRSVTEIEASPQDILKRIVKERHLWDDQILHWEVLETLDENTDVFHYETQSVAPSVKRDFVVLRSWRTNLSGGSCGIVMTSVKHKHEPPSTGVRGTILACRCLIEPIGLGRSRMTYIARIDLRGRSSRYYNKAIAPRIMSAAVREVRESFNCGPDGPETNV